jgi:stage IV sporulation protein FB
VLAEPQPTPWDLHFRVLGISVRISPWFWAASIFLGWSLASSLHDRINIGLALLIWTSAVLVSILVHELGHSLTFRYFGVPSHIVLYQFGGLAIPERAFASYGRQNNDDSKRQILISVAGPAAQLLLAIVVGGACFAAGYAVGNPLPFIQGLDFLNDGEPFPSLPLAIWLVSLVSASVGWALLNLLPVYPLDGGRISRELFTLNRPREGIRNSLVLSMVVAGGVAFWGWTRLHDTFLAIMFLMLAYSSYATLQAYLGRGGGFGGDTW